VTPSRRRRPSHRASAREGRERRQGTPIGDQPVAAIEVVPEHPEIDQHDGENQPVVRHEARVLEQAPRGMQELVWSSRQRVRAVTPVRRVDSDRAFLGAHGPSRASPARRPAALEAIASDWHVGVLALLTTSVASPWLRLRRVPVTFERPSSHAIILRFDYGVTPAFASAVGISRSPLREWHAFATVTTPGQPGFRVLISRAGDWTGRFIDDPPSHVWVRGTPISAPMAKVALLYERVIYVVTGSGIGPCLGQILAARVPARLVWSTRNPRATYGDDLVDEVEAAQPDAVIWDTSQQGKPDLVRLAQQAYQDFDAEAVFVVSNKPTTLRLVHGMERRGIPAFGPIWDS
jgi:hypothetical protein